MVVPLLLLSPPGLPHPGGGFETPAAEAVFDIEASFVVEGGFPHPGGGDDTPADAVFVDDLLLEVGFPNPGGGAVIPAVVLAVTGAGFPHPGGAFVTPTDVVVATLPGTATDDLLVCCVMF